MNNLQIRAKLYTIQSAFNSTTGIAFGVVENDDPELFKLMKERHEFTNKDLNDLIKLFEDCNFIPKKRPKTKIICLCGSTRFTDQMLIKQWELTKQGNIVLSWCALPDSYFETELKDKAHIGDQEGVKEIADEVHKRKIDISDEIFVLNIDSYIGESTRSEIDYAKSISKPIFYLEKESVSI